MGSGIAAMFAPAAHETTAYDSAPGLACEVAGRIQHGVAAAEDLETAVRDADLIIEAVAEDVGVKEQLFMQVSRLNATALIASNTSTILPSVLARSVQSPDRFVVTHFFNPPTVVPLVEVVPAPDTSESTVTEIVSLLSSVGKLPVPLQAEVPGFVANRLQSAILREAFALARDGVASLADIDLIVRAGLGSRWATAGPVTVADLGGLDVWLEVCTHLFPDLATDRSAPQALVRRVDSDQLGAKAGTGFFTYRAEQVDAVLKRMHAHFKLEFDTDADHDHTDDQTQVRDEKGNGREPQD